MAASGTLYDEVVVVTNEYFGPAADRFLTRQIQNHLHKNPEQLQEKDLETLITWISLAMSLITDDTKLINKYVANLKVMASQ